MAFNRTLQHFTSSQELATVWETGKDYIVNQLVLESERLYRCSIAHTSGATFAGDSGNWAVVKPGEIIQIADGGTGQATASDAFDALSPTTTKGDIIVRDGSSNTRLATGTYGQTLIADSNEPTGLKWVTPQQGTKNYITSGTFESGTDSGWSLANSTLNTIKLPNQAQGSWGSSSSLTKSISSSEKLAGAYSLKLSASVAAAAGDMLVTDAIDLDLEAQASVQTFSFYYKVISGDGNLDFSGTSSNTLGVAIYVVDGTLAGTWIQPAGVFNLVQKTGVGKASGTFQVPSDATQLRLAIYCANASAGSFDILLDDFVLGPQAVQYGAPVSDWTDFALTSNWTTNTELLSKARRVGDVLEVQFSLRMLGTPTNADLLFQLPSQYQVDTVKLLNSSGPSRGGHGWAEIFDSSAGDSNYFRTVWWRGDASGFRVKGVTSNGSVTPAPIAYANGDRITGTIFLPIQGWSSSVEMSNDTDTRVVAFRAVRSTTISIPDSNPTNLPFISSSIESDTHGAYNETLGGYVCPVSGYYNASGQVHFASATSGTRNLQSIISLNGSYIANQLQPNTSGNTNLVNVSGNAFFCNAGDVISIVAFQNEISGSTALDVNGYTLSVFRISGPATIAASETVAVIAKVTADGQSLLRNTVQTITGWTVSKDTHGIMDGSTGVVSIPTSGYYEISLQTIWADQAWTTSTTAGVGFVDCWVYASSGNTQVNIVPIQANFTGYMSSNGTILKYLDAGESVTFRVRQYDGVAGTKTISAATNVSIIKRG